MVHPLVSVGSGAARAEVKFIGVCATQEEADRAVERFKRQPGFKDHPDGFSVDRYEVGKDHWTEGFVTVNPEA